MVGREDIKQLREFKYLGNIISDEMRCGKDAICKESIKKKDLCETLEHRHER